MFTGLIETIGQVVELTAGAGSTRIAIRSDLPLDELRKGESIAVDGVCLTVAELGEDRFCADVVAESLARTTLRGAHPGDRVNLERSVALGERLGGHLVQGHVDAPAKVLEVLRERGDHRLRIESAAGPRRYLAEKGSVALQGVALTIAANRRDSFEVALIPETLASTTLSDIEPGDLVNVEVDLVARYLESLLRFPR